MTFPSKNLISNLLSKLKNNHAVIPIIKTNDAAKRVKKNMIFKKPTESEVDAEWDLIKDFEPI